MKKYFIFILLLCFGFVLASCDINLKPSDDDPTPGNKPISQSEEYDLTLKKSRALNQIKTPANESIEFDEDYFNNLQNMAFKLYEMFSKEEDGNYCVSPLSIYMALSLLDLIGDEQVKEEISELLSLTEEEILSAGKLFNTLSRSYQIDEGVYKKPITLTNSIWLDTAISPYANQTVLDELANQLYCYAYETPFSQDNEQANLDIRKFIAELTKGLIDENFDIPASTLFALINTLYFNDNWNANELKQENRNFNLSKEKQVLTNFLIGDYRRCLAYEDEIGMVCKSSTTLGYELYFFIPKAGHTFSEVMNNAYFNKALLTINDDKNRLDYTRCIFPEFEVASDTKVKDILAENNYLSHAFSIYHSALLAEPLQVSDIIHKAVLKVDKKGITGAAVTIILNKATSAGPQDYKYHDFLVDQPFGYVLAGAQGRIVLFMGQITDPTK